MTEEQHQAYRSHVRGAAAFVLFGKVDAPMNVAELVRRYGVEPVTVNADIDAIVESERHKPGGVFEIEASEQGMGLAEGDMYKEKVK